MYWVYENWHARGHRVKIHRAACPFCKSGHGFTTGTDSGRGRWLGPYEAFEEAQETAKAIGADFSNCQKCL